MTSAAPVPVYCQKCGSSMDREDRFCRKCGYDSNVPLSVGPPAVAIANASDKRRVIATLLCILLGPFGAHRFYVGKIGTGILWLITLGFLGIGVIVDLIFIIAGEFRDSEGRKLIIW